tara:strand:+ start:496 stop:678 length:183 start_codon:yes stop_codon:yes gene_type:complete
MNKLTKSEEREYNAIRKILFSSKDFWNKSNDLDTQIMLNRYNFLANKKTTAVLKKVNNNG